MRPELTCGEARELASALLDGGLTEADEAAVKAHVSACGTCPGLYRAMIAAHERLQVLGAAVEVPAALAANLGHAIVEATR